MAGRGSGTGRSTGKARGTADLRTGGSLKERAAFVRDARIACRELKAHAEVVALYMRKLDPGAAAFCEQLATWASDEAKADYVGG